MEEVTEKKGDPCPTSMDEKTNRSLEETEEEKGTITLLLQYLNPGYMKRSGEQ